jgi:hypothetical protein
MADKPGCHYCTTTEKELRPYGPGGTWVCYPCATATPEREQETARGFGALLEAADTIGGGVATIGHTDGPRPGVNLDTERDQ